MLGSQGGQVGNRMQSLYTAQCGAVAGDNIPRRTTRYNGKNYSAITWYQEGGDSRGTVAQAYNNIRVEFLSHHFGV